MLAVKAERGGCDGITQDLIFLFCLVRWLIFEWQTSKVLNQSVLACVDFIESCTSFCQNRLGCRKNEFILQRTLLWNFFTLCVRGQGRCGCWWSFRSIELLRCRRRQLSHHYLCLSLSRTEDGLWCNRRLFAAMLEYQVRRGMTAKRRIVDVSYCLVLIVIWDISWVHENVCRVFAYSIAPAPVSIIRYLTHLLILRSWLQSQIALRLAQFHLLSDSCLPGTSSTW